MNNNNCFKNLKTIELELVKDKLFSVVLPWEISDCISKEDYEIFIRSINELTQNYNLLLSTVSTFILSFIFFTMFKSASILLAWLLQVIFMIISGIFFYKYQKYNSFTRYKLIQERILAFNRQKTLFNIPLQMCLLKRKKEQINYFSGESDDIFLIISYSDNDLIIPDFENGASTNLYPTHSISSPPNNQDQDNYDDSNQPLINNNKINIIIEPPQPPPITNSIPNLNSNNIITCGDGNI